jgi:hypothetical protein
MLRKAKDMSELSALDEEIGAVQDFPSVPISMRQNPRP